MKNNMTKDDLIVGRCYEAKSPKVIGIIERFINDRQIVFINATQTQLQYDSPSVRNGAKYPTVTIEQFLKWAKRDVTIEMPKGTWRIPEQKA